MYFFAPIPWEADLFYQQKGLIEKNLTLNWHPVGTGAYYLSKNNPSKEMILKENVNFHNELYPSLNKEKSKESDAGKKLPFVKEVIYRLEKESIPFWNKFLQGYYDSSGVSSEAFDQAVQVSSSGSMGLSSDMAQKGIVLKSYIRPTIYYMAFNMEDPIVGGYSKEAKKLRQAISIAINEEEFISIFMNERGVAAQGPIPPEIFGYDDGEKGTNKVIYNWENGKRVRKPIEEAKKLLAQAGYPNGISTKTGKKLKLHYDATATGPDDRTMMDWRRKQFAKLGIGLVIRSTDYNRFQDKVRKAKVQIYSWGWNADYPDPENFLFLLYGGNAIVNTGGSGINSSNYQNEDFDKLFNEIKTMKNTDERKKKIEKMLEIVREDAPWVWGFHSKSLALTHEWFKNVIPNAMANNTLKYKRIDNDLRVKKQKEWNQPVLLPLAIFMLLIIVGSILLYKIYTNRQKAVIKRYDEKKES
jgi:ABC-type transport system substrate-binding protein